MSVSTGGGVLFRVLTGLPSRAMDLSLQAVIAQLAARRSHNAKVVSSILTHRTFPISSFRETHDYALTLLVIWQPPFVPLRSPRQLVRRGVLSVEVGSDYMRG